MGQQFYIINNEAQPPNVSPKCGNGEKSCVLGIESSCDDTAAAVIIDGVLRSSIISSQSEHIPFGGVVPELASRAHDRLLVPVVQAALQKAGIEMSDLTGIAVTRGPGLIGSLMVGVSFAKSLSAGLGIPLVGVHHLDGHMDSLWLGASRPDPPLLVLIVSGGHTQLMRVDASGRRIILGKTRDDAAGEAFDKVAAILGLEYPGGPEIDRLAAHGNAGFHEFPRTRLPDYDWSFSGIKTSVLYHLNRLDLPERTRYLEKHLADLCASFQEAVVDMLVEPVQRAMEMTGIRSVGLVGGVSANSRLRDRLEQTTSSLGGHLHVPDLEFSMDNAAMIALSGSLKLARGEQDSLFFTAHPSLSMDLEEAPV